MSGVKPLDSFSKKDILRVVNEKLRRDGLLEIERIEIKQEIGADEVGRGWPIREVTVRISGVANQLEGLLSGTHSSKDIDFPDLSPDRIWFGSLAAKSVKTLWDFLYQSMRIELDAWETILEE